MQLDCPCNDLSNAIVLIEVECNCSDVFYFYSLIEYRLCI